LVTEDIAEWGYGDYEGLLTSEIRKLRQEKGLDKEQAWDIWRDGCEGGEYVIPIRHLYGLLGFSDTSHRSSQEASDRMDRLIAKIHDIQRPYMHGEKAVDVVVVSCTIRPSTLHVTKLNDPHL
jgi:broad specificity phosphatase PhoE